MKMLSIIFSSFFEDTYTDDLSRYSMVRYMRKLIGRRNMAIVINKVHVHDIHGDTTDLNTSYTVTDNGKEFSITCRSNHFGRTFSLAGKEGTLYIEREDNKVHIQKVALGGGCGLLIDDEPVEGLSPLAIHGIIIGENNEGAKEIIISDEHSRGEPTVLVDGNRADYRPQA